ncbi:MAG: hypothetical protein ACREQ9_01450, partial [Candidatus Binatia bacterium]
MKARAAKSSDRRVLATWAVGLALLLETRAASAQVEAPDSPPDLGTPDAAEPVAASEPTGQTKTPEPPGERRRALEEIIVTAQKTEQSLHDVPISISVLNDEFLDQQSISDFAELSHY